MMKKLKTIVKTTLGSGLWLNYVFRLESKGINHGLENLGNLQPSVFFFTSHKCASTFTPKVFAYVAQHWGLNSINYAGYLWHKRGDNAYEYLNNNAKNLFPANGYVFSPLRRWVNIQEHPNSKVIIMLRDPRDVLLSMYYSMAYTHNLPANRERRKEFLESRRRIASMDIDEIVLEKAPHLVTVYREYFTALSNNENYYFCTYEQMILDFLGWIEGLENYLDIQFDKDTKEDWRNQVTPPSQENLIHKRKMLPGDFNNKLRVVTIEQLNSLFSDYLHHFEYPNCDSPQRTSE